MKMMSRFVQILQYFLMMAFVLLSSGYVSAQSYHTSSKKAIKYFQTALENFFGNKPEALEYVNKSLQYDDKFVDAILLKAELCLELNQDSLATDSFERLLKIDSMAFPKSAISLSKLYTKHFRFDESESLLNWYLSLDGQKESLREIAERQLIQTNYCKSLVNNPVDYNPKNIGDAVNTSADEYVNQFYVNENKLIFTKRYKSVSENNPFLEENVFETTMYDSVWSIPAIVFGDVDDIGAANISDDGNEIYFAGNNWTDGMGSCDIYYVEFKKGRWSLPKNIKSINTSNWESQPCVSRDGKELYFVRRDRKLGTSDIYVSMRGDDGAWLKPNKLDSNINTSGNEMAPFIHHDGVTLYFSSDGHLGMGGYDLFMSRRDNNAQWMKSENLGYPLNTAGDEINIVVSNDATKAYMSALREEGYGAYDIYAFDLDEKFRPDAIEIDSKTDEEYYAENLEKQDFVVLKHIYFKFDSADLTDSSDEGVDAVYNFLISNPEKNILLEGHTDDVGNEEYNVSLSERRAGSVKKALVDKGISECRIKTKGHGSSRPLFLGSDEQKAMNRRVEMRLL